MVELTTINKVNNIPIIGNKEELFKGTPLENPKYAKKLIKIIKDKPLTKISSELYDKGIRRIIMFPRQSIEAMTFEELTLIIFPITEEVELNRYTLRKLDRRKVGYIRLVQEPYNKRHFKAESTTYYYRKKNLIIARLNVFCNEYIYKDFIGDIESLQVGLYNKEEAVSIMMKEMVGKSMNKIITEAKRKWDEGEREKEQAEVEYKDAIKKIRETRLILEGLETLTKNKMKTVHTEIEEIKKFPHIKDVRLTEDGIEVYTGFITINFKRKAYKIGELKFVVSIDGSYKCYNLTRRVGYPHPHATTSGAMCFGDMNPYSQEVNTAMRLKDLVKLLIAWSFTYEPTNGPHTQIETFAVAPGNENEVGSEEDEDDRVIEDMEDEEE